MWSQVFAARGRDSARSSQALESLCRLYWYPIYSFLRRLGHERQDARDLTQGFFAYLIEENLLRKADPDRGRFRSFLLGTLRRFVSNQKAKERALKRGGGRRTFSIDEANAEGRYVREAARELTPEKLFDRRWALEVLGEALRRLEAEYQRAGLGTAFAAMQPYLTGDQGGGFADLAAQLQKTEGSARVMVFRLRHRFRTVIRRVIADTVCDPEQVEDELRDLQAALRSN